MSTGPQVFVIDDDEAIRDSFKALLKSQGFPVQTFPSAERFLGGYEEWWTGCLFIDLRMPGMCGREMVQELLRRGITMPVAIMTGHTNQKSLDWSASDPTAILLEKPFSKERLLEVVRRLMSGLPNRG